MEKVKMKQEDREYFKNGVKTLCGVEVLIIKDFINEPEVKKTLAKEDIEFMQNVEERVNEVINQRIEHEIERLLSRNGG